MTVVEARQRVCRAFQSRGYQVKDVSVRRGPGPLMFLWLLDATLVASDSHEYTVMREGLSLSKLVRRVEADYDADREAT